MAVLVQVVKCLVVRSAWTVPSAVCAGELSSELNDLHLLYWCKSMSVQTHQPLPRLCSWISFWWLGITPNIRTGLRHQQFIQQMIEQTMLEVTKMSMESGTQWQKHSLCVRTHAVRCFRFLITSHVFSSGETWYPKTHTESWRETAFSLTGSDVKLP